MEPTRGLRLVNFTNKMEGVDILYGPSLLTTLLIFSILHIRHESRHREPFSESTMTIVLIQSQCAFLLRYLTSHA